LVLGIAFRIEGTSGNLVPRLAFRWSPSRTKAPETAGSAAPAADPGVSFAGYFGPERDGAVPDVKLARDWTARPPNLLWTRDVGAAWSGFAVARGRAVTQEQSGAEELVVCYDLTTGKPLWRHGDATRYETVLAGEGPRASPVIDGDLVFT